MAHRPIWSSRERVAPRDIPAGRLRQLHRAVPDSDPVAALMNRLQQRGRMTDRSTRRIELVGDYFFVDKQPFELMAVLRDEVVRLA